MILIHNNLFLRMFIFWNLNFFFPLPIMEIQVILLSFSPIRVNVPLWTNFSFNLDLVALLWIWSTFLFPWPTYIFSPGSIPFSCSPSPLCPNFSSLPTGPTPMARSSIPAGLVHSPGPASPSAIGPTWERNKPSSKSWRVIWWRANSKFRANLQIF